MKAYSIKLTALGDITQLPDSQKIFGALVYAYSEKYGSDKTTRLVRMVKNKKTEEGTPFYLSLSNLLPEGFFPTPKSFLIRKHASKGASLTTKEGYRQWKCRDYVTEQGLLKAIRNPNGKTWPYITIEHSQQIRVAVESDLEDIPGLDNDLFSVPRGLMVRIHNEEEEKRNAVDYVDVVPEKKFNFFLAIEGEDSPDIHFESFIRNEIKDSIFVLGNRSSQGYNRFLCEEEPNERDFHYDQKQSVFLNLGMLLPDQIDYANENATLSLFTSERRPMEMVGGWQKNLIRDNYISFVSAGSVVVAPDIMTAGKSVDTKYGMSGAIVFGNAFLYPLSI